MRGIAQRRLTIGQYAVEQGLEDTEAVRQKIKRLGGVQRLQAMSPEARVLLLGMRRFGYAEGQFDKNKSASCSQVEKLKWNGVER